MGTVKQTKLAVVTGASSGIGLALAVEAVKHGFHLLICAEDAGIHKAARELSATGDSVKSVRADLASFDGVEELAAAVQQDGRPVDALLMNAGVGVGGAFLETSLEAEIRMISLNATSLVHLAKRLVPDMVARGQGKVLITSSVAGTAPAPYLAVYGATKAFALSFAEALRSEISGSGVTVTALQPGATDTNFFVRADMETTRAAQGRKDDPAEVAKAGFAAMLAGKDSVVAASIRSRLQGLANEVLPESIKARMQGMQTKPGSGSHKA